MYIENSVLIKNQQAKHGWKFIKLVQATPDNPHLSHCAFTETTISTTKIPIYQQWHWNQCNTSSGNLIWIRLSLYRSTKITFIFITDVHDSSIYTRMYCVTMTRSLNKRTRLLRMMRSRWLQIVECWGNFHISSTGQVYYKNLRSKL